MSSVSSMPSESDNVRLWDSSCDQHDTIGLRAFGFWLYMMSDAMIFAGLFAAHGVYTHNFAGSFTARQVIHPIEALWPTLLIFTSVLAYGLAMVSLKANKRAALVNWIAVSFILGIAFVVLECWTFAGLAAMGAGPQQSGFLSDFWIIVLTHTAHVFFGLIWMAVMLVQGATKELSEQVVARLINLRIFWFFQAIIWVVIFTFVYLMGVS